MLTEVGSAALVREEVFAGARGDVLRDENESLYLIHCKLPGGGALTFYANARHL